MYSESHDSYLSGKVVFVVASGTDLGETLAEALYRNDVKVALISDTTTARASDSILTITTSLVSRQSVSSAFSEARLALGHPHMVIHSATPPASLTSCPIETLSHDLWIAATHTAMKCTICCLQAAHDQFCQSGGRIVVFGPSLSLVGASGLVPLSTALEAQRTLVKSAARQWGHKGIRVNWIALGAEGNYPALRSAAVPQVPEFGPPPPPLGRVPDMAGDVAGFLSLLAAETADVLTGATLVLDGGNWMVP